uniref:Elongation factor G, mitochondrial n=1 Tax=Spumella elongata TaxID=89044 RepID=A0A7S3MFH5_9STRA|mmetsp:Transcript_57976/g.101874  ORF Transcript_57976/g.101874 Transcript_57976/m.101874 type:complete len:738 (+) Transcript_57976:78-2291(+)|eukprot:CAMPEP_0184966782 /NCGR_PEP_ID=MMETSP1098-20130426/355_1 /TAXON_ID=89044 /ORGANISM="Spumella elongata, Strain CCAP 955/1" /LENGTH=737 /DNA_ID=CAMNT_0027488123 /DNA_START=79 /DNA_END=2292 /DNA_ORIENTATION=-
MLNSARRAFVPLQIRKTLLMHPSVRALSTVTDQMRNSRNIGISAHIDSGKTTLTERILFYTGRINEIHDVRGKDGVGAKMDSMDLEREKGITIQSAATYCRWGQNHINIIDTPGHVDFTVEVERALRVLDGAILVVCGVSGIQSQTLTVDRQMKRYNVPRVAFVNKLDRMGANPLKALNGMRQQLKLGAALVQVPMGLEGEHEGVVDIINREAVYFLGEKGLNIQRKPVPEQYVEQCEKYRAELIERVADIDDEIAELFMAEEEPTPKQLKDAIRRQTIARKFVPVFMGSAFKNKGVQLLLDGVNDYLPAPPEVRNVALDVSNGEAEVELKCDGGAPLVALAFKLEESKFGQLTYVRIYQGTLKKGSMVLNTKTGKKVKVPRLVRMHSNEMLDVDSAGAGDVVALFGMDCSSMDTFTDGTINYSMVSMFVPNPVMSLSVKPKESSGIANFGKAMGKFTREDPTLRVDINEKTGETVMSGMGELHLEIYVERMKREYNVECVTGNPAVAYKETITNKATFDYLHKKQSGGSGQYAKVQGYIEPLEDELIAKGVEFEFDNQVVGMNIPTEYITSCEKGARAACLKGVLSGNPLVRVRVVLIDGAAHAVDSNDLSFQLAMQYAIRQAVKNGAKPQVLQPVMSMEVEAPGEFQGSIVGALNKRGGLILASDVNEDGTQVLIKADVPLVEMFGYSTVLRSSTQGKGEFSMEYKDHQPVSREQQDQLVKAFLAKRQGKEEEED